MMNGTSVKGMRVLLTPENESKKSDQMEITSDANGVARFSRVKPGRYYVEAVRLGVTVGPGTVIVSASGTAEEIAVEWPLRPVYSVIGVAGRFQRHIFSKTNPIDGYVHPQVGPLAEAKLTLSRVDSEAQVETLATDADGNFAFHSVEPGAYLLHIVEQPSESEYSIDDYLLMYVDPTNDRADLRLQVDWSSCGILPAEIQ